MATGKDMPTAHLGRAVDSTYIGTCARVLLLTEVNMSKTCTHEKGQSACRGCTNISPKYAANRMQARIPT